ncbi:hypothetical protein AB0M79_09820 [Polymorphospora sp. NPDC051019]|uniref:hypothetical protein n=1 Tax=Polymorphospora sp. NPDC051019 TaxID=3155725 RepID=UPI00343EDCAA
MAITDETWKQRYSTAVYLVVGLVGLVAGIVSLGGSQPQPLSALLLGFGSSLLAGAVTFLVLRAFLLDRDLTSDRRLARIEHLVENRRRTLLVARQDIGLTEIGGRVALSRRIDAVGYALDRFLDDVEDDLIKTLRGGADVRILLVAQDGPAGALVQTYSENPAFLERTERALAVLDRIHKLVPNGKLRVRWLDWVPSCAIYLVDCSDGPVLQVEIYPPAYNTSPGSRPVLIFRDGDQKDWYNFFVDQFERLWATGRDASRFAAITDMGTT